MTIFVLWTLESRYVFNYPVNDAVVSWQGALPGNLVARSRIGVTERYTRDPYALWDASIGREFSHLAAHLEHSPTSQALNIRRSKA